MPTGAELVTPLPRKLAIRTAGRRLREILDEIVTADPRYEWRDVDGVVVIRPSQSWSSSGSALHVPVRSLSLQNIDASDAITALALMVEHRTAGSLPDTRLFSVDIPDGSTFLEALNAMVRAHGSLAWIASPPAPRVAGTDARDQRFVKSIMLFSGSSGTGFSVREGSFFTSEAIVMERHDRDGTGWTFDWGRVVPLRPDGQPLEASSIGPGIVSDLARAMRMPMGIESLPPAPAVVRRLSPGGRLPDSPPGDWPHEPAQRVMLSGLTLGAALAQLTLLDPRYQWRDMGGVVVFRPVAAWSNPRNALSRRIEAFRLRDAVLRDVVMAFNTRLGLASAVEFTDVRRFSIDSPAGPIVNVLNAIVRSHGLLYWHWEPSDDTDRKWHPAMAHRLTFGFMSGTGMGFLVP